MATARLRRPPSQLASPPPCAEMPERWLDRSDRTHALSTCLQCPIRRWCAQEALRVHASWGMWAGIWIDGRLSPVAPTLRAIATESPLPHLTSVEDLPAEQVPDGRRALPRRRQPRRSGSVAAAVLARSDGHCEVMGSDCVLGADVHVSRVAGVCAEQAPSAAAVFVACRGCLRAIANSGDQTEAVRLGYSVETIDQAARTPLLWRSSRWVRFDECGGLHDVDPSLRATRAS